MARKRNKIYKPGDRINIYLSQDVTSEFMDWINSQSDLSSFFLYAAQKLYDQTGLIDVSEIIPRKMNFNLSSADRPIPQIPQKAIHEPVYDIEESDNEGIFEDDEQEKDKLWSNIEDLDDPFA
ncbi:MULTISPECIES: hypothetical protein [Bacillaceae]|uniref:hypothetical protein n=1 Tax=Bacillaceae TaxID=186817 RepID=UPI000E2FCA97|nr:hypothetical protein [Bacillus sp. HNG]RFB09914.1 hypothetical protein DZB84_23415 [Bacillus sp. HNG]